MDSGFYNMDCMEAMKQINDNFIDLTVTSPPYDSLRTYNGNNLEWTFEKFQIIAKELYRITKQGGVLVWVVGDETKNGSETGTSFRQALYFKEVGFNLHDTMVWYKENCPFPDKTRYYQSFEYMFVLSKGKVKTFNPITDRKNKCSGEAVHGTLRQKNGQTLVPNGKKVGRKVKEKGVRYNTWHISPCMSSAERTGHPAQFPEQLAKDHIISWSNENDVVLDPFMGSGTTGVSCIKTKRKFIGIEKDPDYYKSAVERLEAVKAQMTFFD